MASRPRPAPRALSTRIATGWPSSPGAAGVGAGGEPGRRSRRRRLAVGLVLLAAAAVVANGVTAALEPTMLRATSYDGLFQADRVGWYLESSPPPDVLLMGSSRVHFGLYTDTLEREVARTDGVQIRAMNLGIANGDVELNYLILKNLVSDSRKPKVIVYGLSDYELNSDQVGVDPRYPFFSQLVTMGDADVYGGGDVVSRVDFLLKQLLPVYRDHELARQALSIWLNPDNGYHGNLDSGSLPHGRSPADNGYIPAHASLISGPWEGAQEYAADHLRPYSLDGFRLQRLSDLLDLAAQRQIAVVLVNMPVSPLYRSFWQSPDLMRGYVSAVRDTARRHGTPLIDLYQDSGRYIPPDGYVDGHHLNAGGAEVLSRMVAREYLDGLFARR